MASSSRSRDQLKGKLLATLHKKKMRLGQSGSSADSSSLSIKEPVALTKKVKQPVAAPKPPSYKTQTSKSTLRQEGGGAIQDSSIMSVEYEFRPAMNPKKASPPTKQHYDYSKPISKFPVPDVNNISLISTGI